MEGMTSHDDAHALRPATADSGTHLRIAEARPAASPVGEESVRLLVEQAPEAIFIGTNLCFSFLNPAAVRLFGASRAEELIGQPVTARFHPVSRAQVSERIRLLEVERRQVPATDEIGVALDGSSLQLSISAVCLEFQHASSVLVFAQDVSERRRTETALRHSENLLRWHDATLDREGCVLQLKREVNELLARAGEPVRYNSVAGETVPDPTSMPGAPLAPTAP